MEMGDDDREEFCVSNWGVILPLRLIHKEFVRYLESCFKGCLIFESLRFSFTE